MTDLIQRVRRDREQTAADRRTAALRRLRWCAPAGMSEADLAAKLEWPVGAGAVLRDLAERGEAHERGGVWYLGPAPAASPARPAIAPAATPRDRLIAYVAAHPGATTTELATALGLPRGGLTTTCRRAGLRAEREGTHRTAPARWYPSESTPPGSSGGEPTPTLPEAGVPLTGAGEQAGGDAPRCEGLPASESPPDASPPGAEDVRLGGDAASESAQDQPAPDPSDSSDSLPPPPPIAPPDLTMDAARGAASEPRHDPDPDDPTEEDPDADRRRGWHAGEADVDRWWREGEAAAADGAARSERPYEADSPAGRWWSRGYSYTARLHRALEDEAAIAAVAIEHGIPRSGDPADTVRAIGRALRDQRGATDEARRDRDRWVRRALDSERDRDAHRFERDGAAEEAHEVIQRTQHTLDGLRERLGAALGVGVEVEDDDALVAAVQARAGGARDYHDDHDPSGQWCRATTVDYATGNATRCGLADGHEGLHDDGALSWSDGPSRDALRLTSLREYLAYALDELGVPGDPEAGRMGLHGRLMWLRGRGLRGER